MSSELQARIGGTVYTPDAPGYDDARRAWNLATQQHPAIIVAPQSVNDVVQAVRYANERDLTIAVQTTGHGVILPANDCLLLLTSALNTVRVNADARTARVGAGVQWGAALAQATPHGLAPTLGSSPGVGAVGYTLGGGFGWLGRKYGLSCDNVNWFEVVTAGGDIVRASADENADLFWALRGGGCNFGVVTEMEIRLHPVAHVYGGNLFYPPTMAAQVMARYREWIADAPQELTSSVVLMNFPPFPQVPEFLRGQSFVIVRGAYCGAPEEGEKVLRFWREWQTPSVDAFQTIPFAQIATVSNDPTDPLPGFSGGACLNDLSDDTIATLIQYALPQGGPPLLVFCEVRHAGGAIQNIDPASAAYSNREQELLLSLIAATPTPEAHAAVTAHVAAMKRALGAHLNAAVYLNFLDGQDARALSRHGYHAENFQRLTALKQKYDPRNRFSHSYVLSA